MARLALFAGRGKFCGSFFSNKKVVLLYIYFYIVLILFPSHWTFLTTIQYSPIPNKYLFYLFFFAYGVSSFLQFQCKNGLAFFFLSLKPQLYITKKKAKYIKLVLDKKPCKNVPLLGLNSLILWN